MSPCLFLLHLQESCPPLQHNRVIHNWLRNINLIPFCGMIATFLLPPHCWKENQWRYSRGFPYRLGSAYSCINAIDMKPFSTSVLKLMIETRELPLLLPFESTWVIATTTKICTEGRFPSWSPNSRFTIALTLPPTFHYFSLRYRRFIMKEKYRSSIITNTWAPSIFGTDPFGR